MKYFFLVVLLLWSLGARQVACAQQLLCERQFAANTPRYQKPSVLLRLAPDSLRLVGDYFPAGGLNGQFTRVQRLNLTSCDTLPAGPAVMRTSRTYGLTSIAAANRRGQVLVTQGLYRPLAAGPNGDSARIMLQFFNRNGTPRWRRVLPPQATYEEITGIVEAPDNGFFLCGDENHPVTSGPQIIYDLVLRVDSTGRVLWRRRYRRLINAPLANPTYSRAGTVVCTADYTTITGTATTLMEFNQRGDSLTTRPITNVPQQFTRLTYAPGSLLPLRDGGFALVGQVDSANTFLGPFLARLDRNLNLVWSYIHRPRLATTFAQPQELADGSLIVLANNVQSGRGYPFWLYRFTAAGSLQQAYPFISQVLTANSNNGRNGYFGIAQGLQPLADSSFVVVAGGSDVNSSRIYLAHLRVPGLPRVIDSHYLPPALLATRPGQSAMPAFELFPNPAGETVTLRWLQLAGATPLHVAVRDALGRLVHSQPLRLTSGEASFSISELPPGLYQVLLRLSDGTQATAKLAVAR